MTKAEARELIQGLMDDAGAKLWSTGLLDRLTTTTLDSMWGELLELAPRLTSQLDTITTLTSPGYINLNTVTNGGDLSQRFFRVQSVVRTGQEYTAVDPKHIVVQGNELVARDTRDFVYHIQGDQLWLFPLDTDEDVEIRYSYYPTKFSSLGDGNTIPWPEGYEDAFTFEVAGRAMMKGGREDATALLTVGRQTFANLRSAVMRPHGGMILPYMHMTAQSWGGE